MEGNGLGALLPEMRLDFWDALWEGQISNAAVLGRRLKVLELPISPQAPCCRCVLRLRHGDAYLDHIWRYGRDRLRVAVGNLLPQDAGVVYGVCRLTPQHIYILACAASDMGAQTLQSRVQEDVQSLVTALDSYLALESEIKEVVPLRALEDMTKA